MVSEIRSSISTASGNFLYFTLLSNKEKTDQMIKMNNSIFK